MEERNENTGSPQSDELFDQETQYEMSEEQREYEAAIRRRMMERRRAAERRRVKRNRTVAIVLLLVIVFIIIKSCTGGGSGGDESSSVADKSSSEQSEESSKDDSAADEPEHDIQQLDGLTFVDGILIVNKTYSLPADYAPGVSAAAQAAFDKMSAEAQNDGISLYINSGYRSYAEQEQLYNMYASERGMDEADKVSSRPGHSEHQTGLAFDVNTTEFSFADTAEAKWLDEHCAEFGFIIRFPEGKEDITGYEYEPWHIRYIGVGNAQKVKESGLCLEEYLGVTSDYKYADDSEAQISPEAQTDQSEGAVNNYYTDDNAAEENGGYGDVDQGY